MKRYKRKISVIVATKNRFQLLAKCLESLSKQTTIPDEILITDVGLKGSLEIVKLYSTNLKIRYFHKPGLNAPQARNFGLNKSVNNLTLQIDDDCIAEKNWVKEMLEFYSKHPDSSLITGKLIHIPKENIFAILIDTLREFRRELAYGNGEFVYFNVDNCLINKRSFTRKNITYDRSLFREEDIDLAYQILSKGGKIRYTSLAIVYHHVRPNLWQFLKQRFSNSGNIPRLKAKWPQKSFHFYRSERNSYLTIYLHLIGTFFTNKEFLKIVKLTIIVILSALVYEVGYFYYHFLAVKLIKKYNLKK